MVSKRKFMSMCLIMLVILFMFQFTQVIKESGNQYDVNEYATEPVLASGDVWRAKQVVYPDSKEPVDAEEAESSEEQEQTEAVIPLTQEELTHSVAFVGMAQDVRQKVVASWCEYTKRNLCVFSSLGDFLKENISPEILLIEAGFVDYDKDLTELLSRVEQGQMVAFLTLPSISIIRGSEELRILLGIDKVMIDQVELVGQKMFSGFFLGGEGYYEVHQKEDEEKQDLALKTPWFLTRRGVKTYMVGLLEENYLAGDERRNEKLPALIWRSAYGVGKVFSINGDFMQDNTALGILDAIVAEAKEYDIYPIVNAQNISVVNYPGFADENGDEMQKIYNRNLTGVYRDIIWPGFLAIMEKTGMRMTCIFGPQMDYMDGEFPNGRDLIFYLKQLKEQELEAGISADYENAPNMKEKCILDNTFYRMEKSKYIYSVVYAKKKQLSELEGLLLKEDFDNPIFDHVATVTSEFSKEDAVISYFMDHQTLQNATSDGTSHSFSEDIYMKSIETSLGYSNILLDMKRVAFPESVEDHWEKMSDKFSSNIFTYWQPFQMFDQTTLSESDERIRTFFSLDYRSRLEGKQVKLQVSGRNGRPAWFILRTHEQEVVNVMGGSSKKIEDGAYLIQAEADEVNIELKGQDSHKYEPDEDTTDRTIYNMS